jgi:hypothetical protein
LDLIFKVSLDQAKVKCRPIESMSGTVEKKKGMGSVLVTSFFNFGVEFDSTERERESE